MPGRDICYDESLSATQKLVLIVLAVLAGEDGWARLTVGDLARRCSLCDRSIQNATRKLRERGSLEIRGDQQSANLYRVLV